MKTIFQFLALGTAALALSSCSSYEDEVQTGSYGYVSQTSHIYRGPPQHHHGPYYGSRVYREDVQTVGSPYTGRYVTTERKRDVGRSFQRASLDTRVSADVIID